MNVLEKMLSILLTTDRLAKYLEIRSNWYILTAVGYGQHAITHAKLMETTYQVQR